MKSLKVVLMLAGGIVAFVVVALAIGGLSGSKRDYYYLDVVNTGKDTAEIEVSLCSTKLVVEGGKSKVFTIDQQDAKQEKTPRDFTIKVGSKTEKIQAPVSYIDHNILDVTGKASVVAADYGARYRDKDEKLPEGRREIEVVKIYPADHPRVFPARTFDQEKSQFDVPSIHLGVGEPLPPSIKVSKGTKIPTCVRLVAVPSDTVGNKDALLLFLARQK